MQTNYAKYGYIQYEEIKFIESFMKNDTGTFLETGTFVGKTIYTLSKLKPNWEYHGVDPWDGWPIKSQPYLYYDDPRNEIVCPLTKEVFTQTCPFAHAYHGKYEDFQFDKKFDLIVVSAISSSINYIEHYKKAWSEKKSDGILIGRYYNHRRDSDKVQEAIFNLPIKEIRMFTSKADDEMFAIW